MGTDVVKNVNKNNASHAVLFEALALVSNLLHFICLKKIVAEYLFEMSLFNIGIFQSFQW